MAPGGVMSFLTAAVAMALLVPMGAPTVMKRDLSWVNDRTFAVGPAHIDILVSLNGKEPHSLDGDHFAACKMGDKVTLTCITEGYPEELVNLSWWEDKQSLPFIRQYAQFARSSTTSLDDLSLEDSGRTFSCRADGSTQARTVTLQVDFSSPGDSEDATDTGLHVIVNHNAVMNGDGPLLYGPGDHLSLVCLMQGSNVGRVSWWEGDKELVPDTVTVREHSSSSTLLLRHMASADSGRRLSCCVDDSTLQRTVELLQNKRDFDILPTEMNDQKSIVNIFGSTMITSMEVNTTTIIVIWIGIFVFVVVGLCIFKILKQRRPAHSSNTSPSSSNQGKQPTGSPGKAYNYSRVDATVTPQGSMNRTLIFGRRFSASAMPSAFVGDAAKTHGGKRASNEGSTNPGFVSCV